MKKLRLDHFAGLNAPGADANALARRVHLGLDRLQIDVPAATGNVVRVRDIVTELRLLAADFTDLCHDSYPEIADFVRMWMCPECLCRASDGQRRISVRPKP